MSPKKPSARSGGSPPTGSGESRPRLVVFDGHGIIPVAIVAITALLAVVASVSAQTTPSGTAGAPPAPTFFLGDVNCDGSVNSIDAVFVLQREAGLIDSLRCPDNADMNNDEIVSSVDAGLILQQTAGLIPSFVDFSLSVARPDGLCDDLEKPGQCFLGVDTEFGLSIRVNHPPPEGYIAFQTLLFYGDLTYNPTGDVPEEIAWPESQSALRLDRTRLVAHTASNSSLPPVQASNYRGDIVSLSMTCPAETRSFWMVLLPPGSSQGGPVGSALKLADERWIAPLTVDRLDIDFDGDGIIKPGGEADVPVVATLIIHCVPAPPTPMP